MIISFIIAVYNNSTFLPFAVRSITKQTSSSDIEIIIVDDGSTDGTALVADELAESDGRIKVIHQTNQWIYASFNNGIKAAEGEYIYILNSDDLLSEGAVQLLLDSIERYSHPDMIWTKVKWRELAADGTIKSERDINSDVVEDQYIDSVEMIHDKWSFILESDLATNQANLYKRELALSHPFETDIYAADFLFNISVADDLRSMAVLKNDVYIYNVYQNPDMNASLGKYYGYEHRMFNKMMFAEIELYEKWDCKEAFIDRVVVKRLKSLSHEIQILNLPKCNLSFDEKIDKIFNEIADNSIRMISRQVNREREYESRILNGLKRFLNVSDGWSKISHQIKDLVMYLPANYSDNIDLNTINKERINDSVNAEFNKDHIGKIYYSQNW